MTSTKPTETAIFGMGCFWTPQLQFGQLEGVLETEVGYAGAAEDNAADNPTYEAVCSGNTGHAEVVKVEYDPARITFEALLEQFWAWHDPTTLNRQGPDVGSQYRSVVLTTGDDQLEAATASLAAQRAAGRFGHRDIVTQIAPLDKYYPAEDYHQHFLAKRGRTSCGL
ncbi:MAG: peptide-methionine (S)-S-oxide reductase MsrA [Planctomycetota bacterium]